MRTTIRLALLASFSILALACSAKDKSANSADGDIQDSQVASSATTQSQHFGQDVFSSADPSKDVATNGDAIAAGAGSQLWPAGCVKRVKNASNCNATMCVVNVTFTDCTGPFGLRHVNGSETYTITQDSGGGLDVSVVSGSDFTVNGHPVSHQASAVVKLNADGSGRTIDWQGHWSRQIEDDFGVDVEHTSQLTIDVNPSTHCRTVNGTTDTTTQRREVKGTVTNYQICWGVVGGEVEEFCPSGQLSFTNESNGNVHTITFDGSAKAEIAGPRGSIEWPLVCPAKPLRSRAPSASDHVRHLSPATPHR